MRPRDSGAVKQRIGGRKRLLRENAGPWAPKWDRRFRLLRRAFGPRSFMKKGAGCPRGGLCNAAAPLRWHAVCLFPGLALACLLLAAALLPAATTPTYVGAAACAKCHAEAQRTWAASRHSKMVQPATAQSVKGDFSRGQVQLRGAKYGLRTADPAA